MSEKLLVVILMREPYLARKNEVVIHPTRWMTSETVKEARRKKSYVVGSHL